MLGSKAFEPTRDIYSPNLNIAPISSEINESKKLVVGGCQLSELAKKYGTPLYVLDELTLRTACKTYISSLISEIKVVNDINKSIKFLGWIENKEFFFKKIDVFCSSSLEEPFGLVIIEAMSRGIPVISTNCHGPIDIIKNNKDGLLIEKNNKLELQNAITRLKDNVNLRSKLGLNAIDKYKKKFTFEEYLKNINSLIKNL